MSAKKKLYLATGNEHKRQEMRQLLPDYEIRIPGDDGIDFNPDEDGGSFHENSLIKARALWDIVHEAVIADDSGICVDALDGAPGIYTSRYAGPDFPRGRPDGAKISQAEQNALLIEQLNRTGSKNRKCRYVCAMTLLLSPDRFFVAQETFEGELIESAENQAGTGGFGYDPIVFLPQHNMTVAQVGAEEKNRISHRGKAVRAIAEILRSLEN